MYTEHIRTLRIALLITLSFFSAILFSQNNIEGTVCDEDSSTVILNAHIILWRSDSVIAQCINTEYGFSFENIPDGAYTLSVSHVGYQNKNLTLNVKEHMNLGSIPLTFAYKLDEIIIESYRNTISYKNNLLHVNVKQTYLSELPNMESLLSSIPGIYQTGDGFMSFGKGQILFLVNDREIKSMEEVNLLQPSQIKEIVVDNIPGAKYDSQYSSVINIKTVTEKPALMIYDTNTWARHYSNVGGITSQGKVKETLIDFSFGSRKRKNTLYTEQKEENLQPNNTCSQSFLDTTYSNRMSHDWHIGTQSQFKKSTLNFNYAGYYSSNSPIYNSLTHRISSIGQEDIDILRTGIYKECQHLITVDYETELTQKGVLRFTTDYLSQHRKDDTYVTEYSTDLEKHSNLKFRGRYNIYSFLVNYDISLYDLFKLTVGTRYSNVNNKNCSAENQKLTLYNLYENRYSLYTEATFDWQKLTMQIGLRGESFDKQYHCTAHDVTNYKDRFILPSFSLTLQCPRDLQISLSGNNKVFLPSFNELTPITTYLNQYSYMIGNPQLKPTIRYDFGVGIVWRNKLNIDLGYNLANNERIAYCAPDEDDMRVLKYTYTNIDRTQQITGLLTYTDHLFKRHNINLGAGIMIPNAKIPYMDGYLYQTTPAYIGQLHSNWKVGKITNISVHYTYQSKYYDKANTYSATQDLGCNISIVPVKNKVTLNIQINDILNKAIGNWDMSYGYIHTQQFNNPDNRSIVLSLRYTLNSLKTVRQCCSNSEEIDRL